MSELSEQPTSATTESEPEVPRQRAAVADVGGAQARSQEPIPRIPRGNGIRLSGPEVFRILFFVGLLVGVLALRQPCSDGIGTFIESFDETDAGVLETAGDPPAPAPSGVASNPDLPALPSSIDGYIRFTGDMSDEEIRAKLQQAGISTHDAGPVDATMPEPADNVGRTTP